jgi:hypothetical protein
MIELPEHMTIGEAYAPAMEMTDAQKAAEYFEALVRRDMKYFGKSRQEAEQMERGNLGYFAGYYDSATRERVERLFNCAHPVFGSIAENGAPTAEQALEAGKRAARK